MIWLVVWNSIASHPKWLALTIEQRGAWITLICHASVQEPDRWRFRDATHAALLLRRDGVGEPEAMVNSLIEARWLDVTEDGRLEIHDHADWQRYPSNMPDATAERKRRSRSRGVTSSHESVTSGAEPVTTRREERREDERTPSSMLPRRGVGTLIGDELASGGERGTPAPKHYGQHEGCVVCEPLRIAT
jgi:hypothetical protein